MSSRREGQLLTPILSLDIPVAEDAPALTRAICESLESLRPWMEWAQTEPTMEGTLERIEINAINREAGEVYRYIIRRHGEEPVIGACALHVVNAEVPAYGVGYWIHKDYCGNGYATEALVRLTRFGFEAIGVQRIELCCDPLNVASMRVAVKAGYRFEGELRNEYLRPNGEVRNTMLYSIIPSDIVGPAN